MNLKTLTKISLIKTYEYFIFLKYLITPKREIDYQKEFKKIAILSLYPHGYGDLVMATPFLKTLRKGFPNARIHLITDKDLFDEVPIELDKIHLFKLQKSDDKIYSIRNKMFSIRTEFRKYQKEQYDLIIIMNRSVNQYFYAKQINSRFLVGYLGGHQIQANFILKEKGLYFNKDEHFSFMSLKVAKALGLKSEKKIITLPKYSSTVTNNLKKKINNLKLDKNKKTIIIAPHANWETRRWDDKNFVKLIEKLHSKYNFILYGGPDSVEVNKKILRALNEKNINVENLAGKLSLKESICCLEHADLFLTNDTGPMHFAFMMKCPTLAIFGPVNPNHRLPFDYKKQGIYSYVWAADYKKISLYNYESKHIDEALNGLKMIPVKDIENKIIFFFKNGRFY